MKFGNSWKRSSLSETCPNVQNGDMAMLYDSLPQSDQQGISDVCKKAFSNPAFRKSTTLEENKSLMVSTSEYNTAGL